MSDGVNNLFPGNNGIRLGGDTMALIKKKRIFYILIMFTLIFTVYIGRIGWIQYNSAYKAVTASGHTGNEMAVRQREEGIELDSGRGQFSDRNGVLLTGITRWEPVLFPVAELPEEKTLDALATILGTSRNKLRSIWSTLKTPYVWPYNETIMENSADNDSISSIPGFEMMPYVHRYPEAKSGKQWMGFISQRPDVILKLRSQNKQNQGYSLSMQVGAAGLEKTFDSILRGIGGTRVYYTVDGQKRPLTGIGLRVKAANNRYYPITIQTTIDNEIQSDLEHLAEKMELKEGAIVVLDAKQGDIVSMVSRPFYDPYHVNMGDGSWSNKAVKAAVPGSIFKVVIAAAALEEKVTNPHEMFNCSGHYGKYGLSCWKDGGHGNISLSEGFAQSCNIVFATLGERLSVESINRTADKLGLSRVNGWHSDAFLNGEALSQIDQEEAGRIFYDTSKADGGTLAQTAIGQRDVLMTPLQAANLVVTLLNNGIVYSPRMVSTIHFKDGSTLAELPTQSYLSKEGRIHPETANLLLSWMRQVVTDGTGRTLISAKWPLAGKSGTAQIVNDGEQRNNQWFIGYGPVGKPKYAVAVLSQNRPVHSDHQAMQIFRSTMNILEQHEQKK